MRCSTLKIFIDGNFSITKDRMKKKDVKHDLQTRDITLERSRLQSSLYFIAWSIYIHLEYKPYLGYHLSTHNPHKPKTELFIY